MAYDIRDLIENLSLETLMSDMISNISPTDPFKGDTEKYLFHVDEFAMGNLDGTSKRFYAAVSYPTASSPSFLSYSKQKESFAIQIVPLGPGQGSVIPGSTTEPFPWSTAPSAATKLKAEIPLADILGSGLVVTEHGDVDIMRPVSAFAGSKRPGATIVAPQSRFIHPSSSPAATPGPSDSARYRSLSPFSVGDSSSATSAGFSLISSQSSNGGNMDRPLHETMRRMKLKKIVLMITVRRPPRFKLRIADKCGELVEIPAKVPGGKINTRQGTSADFRNKGSAKEGVLPAVQVEAEQEQFRISDCLTYRFVICTSQSQIKRLTSFLQKLRLLSEHDPQRMGGGSLLGFAGATNIVQRPIKMDKEVPVLATPQWVPSLNPAAQVSSWPFSTRWLVAGLVSHGIILAHEESVLAEALVQETPASRTFEARDREEASVRWRARVLESLFVEDRLRNIVVRKRAALYRMSPPPEQAHVRKTYRVHITPTRMLLFPPEWETDNSVLRHFGRVDRFIRVTFMDEDNRISVDQGTRESHQLDPLVGVLSRVKRCLSAGLLIADRRYTYLAAVNSQMREHGCWFLNEGPDLKVADIRSWAGNIRETVVAKQAARMGLPFSASRHVDVRGIRLGNRPDVVRNGFTFTDGCGACSQDLANAAARAMGIKKGPNTQPSAIQFRLGGPKGVLVVDPDLTGYQYSLRASCEKFTSELQTLNVIQVGKYQPGYLNRQFIAILQCLGCSEDLLIGLFRAERDRIVGIPDRYAQGRQTRTDSHVIRRMTNFPVETLVNAGFGRDALITDILKVIECHLLSALRHKARLPVEHSAFLIGVADEEEVLREGEVFCQIDDGSGPTIVTGKCLITRAPAMHPGDVRLCQAVDRPELRHIKNVIVFNVQGERDLPNM